MAQLWPLEAPGNPRIGGVLFKFPTGLCKEVRWEQSLPIVDTLGVAKHLAARVLDDLLKEGKREEAERTNWTSVTAALQKLVKDWSDKLRAHAFAQNLSPDPIRPS